MADSSGVRLVAAVAAAGGVWVWAKIKDKRKREKKRNRERTLSGDQSGFDTDVQSTFSGPYDDTDDDLNCQQPDGSVRGIDRAKQDELNFVSEFNYNPKKGIELMLRSKEKCFDPANVAYHLFNIEGLRHDALGEYFGSPTKFARDVLACFAEQFSFKGHGLDEALRLFLQRIMLPKEAQQIERIMEAFAKAYHKANPIHDSSDTVYILAFSLIMLNTDAHNPKVKNKMTLEEFKRFNVQDPSVTEDILDSLYYGIVNNELDMHQDQRQKLAEISHSGQYRPQYMHHEHKAIVKGLVWKWSFTQSKWRQCFLVLAEKCLYFLESSSAEAPFLTVFLDGARVLDSEEMEAECDNPVLREAMLRKSKLVRFSVVAHSCDASGTVEGPVSVVIGKKNGDRIEKWKSAIRASVDPFAELRKQRQHRALLKAGAVDAFRNASKKNPRSPARMFATK